MSSPFVDQPQRDFLTESEAAERVAHLQLVHNEMEGGEQASDDAVMVIARDLAEGTDSANYILSWYAANSDKFPDFSKRVRDLICGVMGATSASAEFVPVTDEDLAARMGCTTKTVQRARDELRSWPEYSKLISIKDNWRHPETGESFPHSYLCHITLMSAAATADARLSPRYGTEKQGEAFRDSAAMRAQSAKAFVGRPPKRKRKLSDAEKVLRETKNAGGALQRAADLGHFARGVDRQELYRLRRELQKSLDAFDAAWPLEDEAISFEEESDENRVHLNTDIRRVDTEEAFSSDESSLECRVDSQVDRGQVDKLSTRNDSTESTVYEFDESASEQDFDVSRFVYFEGGGVRVKYPPPDRSSPELEDTIYAESCRLEGKGAHDG